MRWRGRREGGREGGREGVSEVEREERERVGVSE